MPRWTYCWLLMLVLVSTTQPHGAYAERRRPATAPEPTKPQGQIVVVAAQSDCRNYFLADGPMGHYLIEWYGGHSPGVGDIILGDLGGFGLKDVLYPGIGSSGRVYVDDYMLSRSRAIEKFSEKCN